MRSKSLFAFLAVAALGTSSQASSISVTAPGAPVVEGEAPKKQPDLNASQSQKAVNLL